MKIRLAKKIMSKRTEYVPLYHVADTWTLKWVLAGCKDLGCGDSLFGKTFFGNKYPKKVDNRIYKAKRLEAKCRARDILHDVEKKAVRSPFSKKGLESYRYKLESYKV